MLNGPRWSTSPDDSDTAREHGQAADSDTREGWEELVLQGRPGDFRCSTNRLLFTCRAPSHLET